jgi:hypothetical protein
MTAVPFLATAAAECPKTAIYNFEGKVTEDDYMNIKVMVDRCEEHLDGNFCLLAVIKLSKDKSNYDSYCGKSGQVWNSETGNVEWEMPEGLKKRLQK